MLHKHKIKKMLKIGVYVYRIKKKHIFANVEFVSDIDYYFDGQLDKRIKVYGYFVYFIKIT